MENEDEKTADFHFLTEDAVSRCFADLNIKLLSGRHILSGEYSIFAVLEDYYPEFKSFYLRLYNMELVRKIFDQSTYYYLNFFDGGRGKLADPSRYRAITEIQTITALMLLDMYFARFFDPEKKITWTMIKEEISTGDHRTELQRMLFPELRVEYSETEWQSAERRFKAAISKFNDLAWVSVESTGQEELCFVINPSIHRIAELYEAELQDITTFAEKVKAGRTT